MSFKHDCITHIYMYLSLYIYIYAYLYIYIYIYTCQRILIQGFAQHFRGRWAHMQTAAEGRIHMKEIRFTPEQRQRIHKS